MKPMGASFADSYFRRLPWSDRASSSKESRSASNGASLMTRVRAPVSASVDKGRDAEHVGDDISARRRERKVAKSHSACG